MECLRALQNRAPIETKSEDEVAAEAEAKATKVKEAKKAPAKKKDA